MFTTAEKLEIIILDGDNSRTAREAAREFNNQHPDRPPIDHVKVWRINNLFNRTDKVCNTQEQRVRDDEQRVSVDVRDAEILQLVRENPMCSLKRMSIILKVPKDTIWRCFRRNKLRPFKPVFLHTLKEGDEERRLEYCFWYQGEFLNNLNFFLNILVSDLATFTTSGTVDSQNIRNWTSTYFKVDEKGYKLRPKFPKSLENYYPKINKPEKNEAQISEIEGPGENTAFSQFSQNNRSVRRPTRRQYIPRQISLQQVASRQVAAKSNFSSQLDYPRINNQPATLGIIKYRRRRRQRQPSPPTLSYASTW